MGRNTRTGAVLENMVLPALTMGGYSTRQQVRIGTRMGCNGAHNVDCIAEKGDGHYLVSLKWQQTTGTAEQKVAFESICLEEAIESSTDSYTKAYLVLGGDGWTLRDYYVSNKMREYVRYPHVEIVTLEHFIALANKGKL